MADKDLHVSVTNIGGIEETETVLEPGVTILEGRNATNRTSFFQALMAAYGSDQASLKGDADVGSVELDVGGETFTRTLEREDGRIRFDGDPFLDDATVADLFAFLVESNEARLAVPRNDDLRDIIMRPVDTNAIKAEIDRLESEKRQVTEEIEELQSLADRLPALEADRREYEERVEETAAELAEKEAEIEALERDVEESQQERRELDEKLRELREARSELEDLQYKLETEQESLASLHDEKSELGAELEDLSVESEDRLERIEEELDRLQTRQQSLEAEVNTLQRVIQFNEEMLDGATADIAETLRADGGSVDGSVTDRLLVEDRVVCWTCGSEVERNRIEDTIDRLRDLHSEKYDEIRSIEEEIRELQPEKQSIESQRLRRANLSDRRDEIEDEVREREETIADLEDRIASQTGDIERLEAEAEEFDEAKFSDVLELHKEANQLEFELSRHRSDLNDVTEEIRSIEERQEGDELERRHERLQSELTDLRTRIERLEQEAVDEFNEHMESMLAILDYSNVERIWLERTQREVRDGRQKVSERAFDLHIVRSTDDGVNYEDTVDHLSESEREVTGLIFALAGYLTHEVYETLPIILLDSLEAIDSDRIANLVDYFEQYVDYLVVALLPEDAQALDDEYARVTGF